MTPNRETGDRGEELAARFLESLGYAVLDRNYRFAHDEVDLVCFEPAAGGRPGGEIVFVEVKTRTSTHFGRPEEAVDLAKQKCLSRAAAAYLYERKLEGAMCRFDVVSILLSGGEPHIEHFRNAFLAR